MSRRGLPTLNSRQTCRLVARRSLMHRARWILSDRHDGLQLDDHRSLDQQVHRVVTDDDPIVHHGDEALLRNREAGFAKLMHEGIFVYLRKKSSSKSIGDSQGTADDPLRQMVQHGFIGVHRRSSAAKISLLPSHQHIAETLTAASVRLLHLNRRQVDGGAIRRACFGCGQWLRCVHPWLKFLASKTEDPNCFPAAIRRYRQGHIQ